VAAELKKIYTAVDADAALQALAAFSSTELGRKYPQTVKVWESKWEQVTPFMAFTGPVKKLLYTTNSIESVNYQLRKVTKARGHFPTDDAVVKLLWLAILNIEDKRARERAARAGQNGVRSGYPGRLVEGQKTYGWPEALNELAAAYPGRIR
jgi:putative transposase